MDATRIVRHRWHEHPGRRRVHPRRRTPTRSLGVPRSRSRALPADRRNVHPDLRARVSVGRDRGTRRASLHHAGGSREAVLLRAAGGVLGGGNGAHTPACPGDGRSHLRDAVSGVAGQCARAGRTGAVIYFGVFTVARYIHSVAYVAALQPWRTVSYVVGLLASIGLIVQVALRALT